MKYKCISAPRLSSYFTGEAEVRAPFELGQDVELTPEAADRWLRRGVLQELDAFNAEEAERKKAEAPSAKAKKPAEGKDG